MSKFCLEITQPRWYTSVIYLTRSGTLEMQGYPSNDQGGGGGSQTDPP